MCRVLDLPEDVIDGALERGLHITPSPPTKSWPYNGEFVCLVGTMLDGVTLTYTWYSIVYYGIL